MAIQDLEKVNQFWEYFLLKTGKRFRLSPDKVSLISKRLKDYSMEDLKTCVDRFIEDDWPERHRHMDLIYCIGKQRGKPDAAEKWLNKEQKPLATKTINAHRANQVINKMAKWEEECVPMPESQREQLKRLWER